MISPVNGTRAALIPASRRLTRRLDARLAGLPNERNFMVSALGGDSGP